MTSLLALGILGIRSFGPDEPQYINFDKTLTVIVGANGCGKTTIIECLRYATTGALPPGASSGQSFVHDPKIARTSEVKAQIKLTFSNRIPQRMLLIRDLQVTVHGSKLSFKALDAVLQTNRYVLKPDGSSTKVRESMSHACSKMDVIMADMLGVPRAVLDHVVFCHQEESNWPLSEGAKLKERFDQIFESARYTKALEDLRKLRKEKKDAQQTAEAELALADAHCNRLREARARIADATAQRDALQAEFAEREEAVTMLNELVKATKEQLKLVASQREAVDRLRAELAACDGSLRALDVDASRLSPAERAQADAARAMSAAEFQQHEGSLQAQVAALEAAAADKQRQLEAVRSALRSARSEASTLVRATAERGARRQQAAQLEAEFDKEVSRVAELYREHGLSLEYRGPYTSAGAASLLSRLESVQAGVSLQLRDVENDLGKKASDAEAAHAAAARALSAASAEMDSRKREADAAGSELRSAEAESRSATAAASAGGESVTDLRARLQSLERDIADASSRAGGGGAVRQRIADAEEDAAAEQARLQRLRRAQAVLMAQSQTRTTLEMVQQQQAEKAAYVKSQLGQHRARLMTAMGAAALPAPDSLAAKVSGVLDAKRAELKQVEAQVSTARDAERAADARVREVEDQLVRTVKRLDELWTDVTADREAAEDTKVLAFPESQWGASFSQTGAGSAAAASAAASGGADRPYLPTVLARLPDVCPLILPDTFPIAMNLVNKAYEAAESKLMRAQAFGRTCAEGLAHLATEHRCLLCDRPVPETGAEEAAVRAAMERGRAEAEAEKAVKDQKVRYEKARRNRDYMLRVQAAVVEYHALFNTAQEARDEQLDAAAAALANASQAVAAAMHRLQAQQAAVDELSALLEVAKAISAAAAEDKSLRARAEGLQGELAAATSTAAQASRGSTIMSADADEGDLDVDVTSLAAVNAALTRCEAGLADARRRADEASRSESAAAQEQLRLQKEQQRLQAQLSAAEKRQLVAQAAGSALQRAQERAEASSRALNAARTEKRKAEEAAAAAEERRAAAVGVFNAQSSKLKSMAASMAAAASKLCDIRDRVVKAHEALATTAGAAAAAAGGSGGASGASAAAAMKTEDERRLEAVQARVAELEASETKLASEAATAQQSGRDLMSSRNALGLVRRWRQANADRERLLKDIAEVNAQLSELLADVIHNEQLVSLARQALQQQQPAEGGGGARRGGGGNSNAGAAALDFEADPLGSLELMSNAFQAQLQSRLMDRAHGEGRMQELEQSIAATQREIATAPEFRKCEQDYRDRAVEAATLEGAVRDLETYYKALDAALMRYHKLKIAEVNSIIKDLWINTYAGGDIDNIEICSDMDDKDGGAGGGAGAGAASSSGAGGRGSKSYNYRVVMIKGGVELDMRGRCSAGQRVLASIVIRLALAESFCVNTGILALDEPTTNLDTANKEGLAKALARIIEMRSGSNLQLIVITHDEEFVSELGRATADGGGPSSKTALGTYYRVHREEPRPGVFHSVITLQEPNAYV